MSAVLFLYFVTLKGFFFFFFYNREISLAVLLKEQMTKNRDNIVNRDIGKKCK